MMVINGFITISFSFTLGKKLVNDVDGKEKMVMVNDVDGK